MDDWSYDGPAENAWAPTASSQTAVAVKAPEESPLIAFLKGLPIIGQILKALGL